MSKHPLQLRLTASNADIKSPSIVDIHAEAVFRDSSAVVYRDQLGPQDHKTKVALRLSWPMQLRSRVPVLASRRTFA